MTLSEYVELLGRDDRQKLESFLKNLGIDLNEISSIEEFKIKLEGGRFHGTISADFAQAICKLQIAFYRFVALALHGDPLATLSAKEKERYQLIFKISEGSTDAVSIGLSDTLFQLVSNTVEKMEGWEILSATVVIAGAISSVRLYSIYKEHQSRQQTLKADAEKRMAELNADTQRYNKLLDVIRPLTEAAAQASEVGRMAIIKSVNNLERASIGGQVYESEDIIKIKNTKHRIPDPKTETNQYFVFDINTKDAPTLKVQLQKVGPENDIFTATLDMSADEDGDAIFSDEQIEMLRRCHWQGLPLKLTISRAILQNGKTRNAVVNDIILDETDR